MKALDLAKYILKKSSKSRSNLELQKTLYFVNLGFIKHTGDFLIDEDFEAWRFGPVLRNVYLEYKNYGANSIARPVENIVLNFDDATTQVIDEMIEYCAKKTYWELVNESHKETGAWYLSYEENKKNIIKKELIRQEALER